MPERPRLRQFVLVATGLVLPLPAVLLGPDKVIPAMAAGVVIGVGFGLGWAFTLSAQWLRRAPLATLGVFATSAACLLHVAVMPRWELLLRARATAQELARYGYARDSGLRPTPPTYRRGQDSLSFAVLDGRVIAFTPQPLQRWTLFGWRDACWLVLREDGTIEKLWKVADFAQAMHPTNGR